MTDRVDMEAVVEAVLFASGDPVSRDKLLEVFAEGERLEAQQAIEAVVERYQESSLRGILIDEVAGGLRLVSRPDLHGYLRRFFEVSGTNKLSMAALETLAVVAYRQPVTGPEIQELRGVNSSGVLKKLLERRLVRIAGRKEVVGKPFLYATTRDFLMHFGLRSLKELPPLEQFEELLGMEAEDPSAGQGDDLDEDISQQVAALDEAEDEAHQAEEAAAIEEERRRAEAAEEDEELAAVAKQFQSDDAVPEETAPEDAVSEDDSDEDLASDDAVSEDDSDEDEDEDDPDDTESPPASDSAQSEESASSDEATQPETKEESHD